MLSNVVNICFFTDKIFLVFGFCCQMFPPLSDGRMFFVGPILKDYVLKYCDVLFCKNFLTLIDIFMLSLLSKLRQFSR